MKNRYFIILVLCVIAAACKKNEADNSKASELESQTTQVDTRTKYPISEEPAAEVIEEELNEVETDVEEAEPTAENTKQDKKKGSKKKAPKGKKPSRDEKPASRMAKPMASTEKVIKSKPFDTDYLMGKFNPNKHKDFSTISSKYGSKGGMRMRTDAYNQLIQMHEAAKKDGITLTVISATRPFHHQKSIWEAKWNGKRKVDGKMLSKNMEPKQKAMKILRWSSMPGTSRHHWGTDIDLNNLNNSYFEKGNGKKVYDWLVTNASTYGFCQVYSAKGSSRPHGYQEEKWHWSYLPVARELTSLYRQKLSNGDIEGFTGSESAELIDIKTKYVLGINPNCN